MIGAISALAILLIAYWYFKTAEEFDLPIIAWVAGGVIVYYVGFLAWMHLVMRPLMGGQFKEHGLLLGMTMDLTAVLAGLALSAVFRSKVMLKKGKGLS